MVVGSELSEQIRSHKDLVKDAAPHYRKSRKFFEGVAAELVQHGHTLDIFTCSLDQVRRLQGRARDGEAVQTLYTVMAVWDAIYCLIPVSPM